MHRESVGSYSRARNEFCPHYKADGKDESCPVSFIKRKIKKFCPLLNFNDETRQEIKGIHHRNGQDEIFMNETVAFHVRRGDKVKMYASTSTDKYVKVLVDKGIHHRVKNCIIISDQQPQEILPEFQASLQKYNVSCEVYPKTNTLVNHGINRQNSSDTLALLAELDTMIRADVFVFTASSNVGVAASSLRGCNYYNNKRDHDSNIVNMFNSLNVDDF